VLRRGGVVALSDMTAEPARLPRELRSLDAWVACIGDALPLDALADLFTDAGLVVTRRERHDDALRELVERADARLRLARVVRAGVPAASVERGLTITSAAREAIAAGTLGYGVVVANRLPEPGV
jgi:arsenite methyltransferase